MYKNKLRFIKLPIFLELTVKDNGRLVMFLLICKCVCSYLTKVTGLSTYDWL